MIKRLQLVIPFILFWISYLVYMYNERQIYMFKDTLISQIVFSLIFIIFILLLNMFVKEKYKSLAIIDSILYSGWVMYMNISLYNDNYIFAFRIILIIPIISYLINFIYSKRKYKDSPRFLKSIIISVIIGSTFLVLSLIMIFLPPLLLNF